ncbi:MAG: 2-amino-4-hydroxy-6-hydroxymethyldihydropteridine diphosphokinase [Firmicutes bacterium]|nr:2-amino-4-hydroxy-6-hydroxymethyldihydropteridine diphosphokinase [Bacillota bacterium]
MYKAYIGIGGNIGDTKRYINQALGQLDMIDGVDVVAVAPLYQSAPVGYTEQSWFINTVASLKTTLTPLQLLHQLQQVESNLHRERIIRWGPRTIDLDLLLYDNVTMEIDELILPHPRMMERAFVMVPLSYLEPDMPMPGGNTAAELAGKLKNEQQIYTIKN